LTTLVPGPAASGRAAYVGLTVFARGFTFDIRLQGGRETVFLAYRRH
jgi:hypothetical protein